MLPYVQLSKPVTPPYRTLSICRNASASASKPRVLEKPTRFNPPSHGRRLKQQIPRQYGPQLTEEQKTEQQTRKYPNMMPAPGTFMHWFLTSRGIHTFITLVNDQLSHDSHSQILQFYSQYVTLMYFSRVPLSSSPPLQPSKTGAMPLRSEISSLQLPTSSLSL